MNLELELERHRQSISNLNNQVEISAQIVYKKELIKTKEISPNNAKVQYYGLIELNRELNALQDALNTYEVEYKKLNNG